MSTVVTSSPCVTGVAWSSTMQHTLRIIQPDGLQLALTRTRPERASDEGLMAVGSDHRQVNGAVCDGFHIVTVPPVGAHLRTCRGRAQLAFGGRGDGGRELHSRGQSSTGRWRGTHWLKVLFSSFLKIMGVVAEAGLLASCTCISLMMPGFWCATDPTLRVKVPARMPGKGDITAGTAIVVFRTRQGQHLPGTHCRTQGSPPPGDIWCGRHISCITSPRCLEARQLGPKAGFTRKSDGCSLRAGVRNPSQRR